MKKGYQFKTFQGVFTPSILTIFGVIMYLRFGWVLGNVGLFDTLFIVTVSMSISLITALSISEYATNMRMGAGGAYYIISRSLGVEAGAAIGLPLFIAKALGVSFYIAGFSESIASLYPPLSPVIVGVCTLIILTVIAYFSADLAIKIQYVILAVIFASLVSLFFGAKPEAVSTANMVFTKAPLWVVFAVFFPAVTGIEAGLSMSGDLEKPERALPLGTLSAVGLSYLVYMAIPIFLNHLKISDYALVNNNLILKDVARWGNLIVYGLWCAAISSTIGALLGAPRTLQALANDGVVFKFIGRGYGKNNDPRIATFISFLVALGGILLGGLNVIASVLTMFFLITYGLLNLAAGLEGMISNPSWRPKFKVHWAWSMAGALACLMIMMMISAGATIISVAVIILVYSLMQKRKISAYWGSMKHGILMMFIRSALYQYFREKPNEKSWRPNILVFSGSPNSRWHLIEIADAISHGKGFLTVAAVLSMQEADKERIDGMQDTIREYLNERQVPAVVKLTVAENLTQGACELIRTYGFGPLLPNTILLGETRHPDKFRGHVELFRCAHENRKNLIVVREPGEYIDRKTAKIDLWWSHLGGSNTGLMLALAYLLTTSPEWSGADLAIKSVVLNKDEKERQVEFFNDFVKKENIKARTEVFPLGEEEVFSLICRESKEADVVFMGLRPPGEGETTEEYSAYYESLIKRTAPLAFTVFVLASEEIDFGKIFKLSDIGPQ